MITRLEFLFPAQVPVPNSPEYWRMIAEIGREGRWTERVFLFAAVLCLIPVVLFGSRAVWQLIRRGSVSPEVFIGVGFLVLGTVGFLVSRSLEEPRKPYRLAAAEYSNYRVVEARVTELGRVGQQRPSYDSYRRIRWQSPPPLAREGWSPKLLVSSKPLFGQERISPEIRLNNDVVYIGLDPSGRLPPLFLGVKRAVR
jgi:hypothetical protein